MNWFAGVMVLNKDQKILALHFKDSTKGWRIPGGKLNTKDGESAEGAALRELREETGLELGPEQIKFIGVHYLPVDGQQWIGYIFMARSWAGTPRIMEPDKHDAIRFIERAELKALNPVLASDIEMLDRAL